jgi:hypothetical protein
MALLLLLVLGCLATAGARAPDLSQSTAAASATSESELSCVEQCTTVPENVSKNDTCLYVTVLARGPELDLLERGCASGVGHPHMQVSPHCRLHSPFARHISANTLDGGHGFSSVLLLGSVLVRSGRRGR